MDNIFRCRYAANRGPLNVPYGGCIAVFYDKTSLHRSCVFDVAIDLL